MKILHVTPYFYGAWAYGGIPRLSWHLAAAEAELGHTVHVVTTDAQDRHSRRPAQNYSLSSLQVRVYRNLSNRLAYEYQFFWPRGWKAEEKFIRDYDLVHIHGHRNLLNSRMAGLAHRAGVPILLQPNGTLVNIERRQAAKKIFDLLLGRRQIKRTRGFVAVADAERKQFLELGLREDRIRVIPNGVEMDPDPQGRSFKREFQIAGDYLLYLGKITPRKGIEHLIFALNLIADPRIMAVVAGNDMGFLKMLKLWTRRLGLTRRVLFPGLLTGPIKAAAYREALFTVYTGRDEIFGLVPWESLLCGTPVIVADDSGCGEWIQKAGAGHVIPYADVRALAEIINSRDPETERQMVERGTDFCRQRLNWKRVAEEMVKYYRELVK